MIERLLIHSLAAGADLTAEEMLDVLWLSASHLANHAEPISNEPGHLSVSVETEPQPLEDASTESILQPEPQLQLHLDAAETSPNARETPATEIGFRTPRPIQDELTLPAALRRLRQVRAPGPRLAVNIDATVDATAEARRLMLVLSRPQERALDLALVIDDAPSMRIWEETFDDLERLLEQTGAFRAVSRWRLDARYGAIRPDTPRSPVDLGQTVHARGPLQPPRRLTDPSGRRLVLVATDARDQAWYTPRPWDAVAAWCAAMPTVLIQVLPTHYWATTAIGDPYITTRARRPAAPNGQYDQRLAWWATDPGGLPLPVVTLKAESVDAWAQALVNGTAWASGITAIPPDVEYAQKPGNEAEPGRLVNDFLSRASPGAQRLARVLASAATLSMPLIAVLRDRLAPETGVLELAEILASGLLEETGPTSGARQPLLIYRPGTRELLQRGTTAFEDWDAYTAVSRYLKDRQHQGGSLRALVPHVGGTVLLDEGDEPFAALHQTLATRLGLTTPSPDRQGQPDPGERRAESAIEATPQIAEQQLEMDRLDVRPLLSEEELFEFIGHKINQLGDNDEFAIVELKAAGATIWRVSRDIISSPKLAWQSVDRLAGDSWEVCAERILESTGDGSLIVRNSSDASLFETFNLLRAGPHIVAAEPSTPVSDLLRQAIGNAALTRPYELVVIRTDESGTLALEASPLFPVGASRGDSTVLRIRCAPPKNQSTSLTVVVAHGDSLNDIPSSKLVTIKMAQLTPGDYDLTAVLTAPGKVEFVGLPVELHEDPRPWPQITATIPPRIDSPPPVHLVCVVEASANDVRLRRRIGVLQRLIASAGGPGRRLTVSVVAYGSHVFAPGKEHEPILAYAWAKTDEQAAAILPDLASGLPTKPTYPYAARLECALHEVARRIPDRDGRSVIVTVGARPPYPARVSVKSEILPCPMAIDWRLELNRLRAMPDITFGAITDVKSKGDIWGQLGHDAFSTVNALDEIDLAAKLGLLEDVFAGPFPLLLPGVNPAGQLISADETLDTIASSESSADREATPADDTLYDHSEEPQERSHEQQENEVAPIALPDSSHKSAEIFLLGPPGSGKTAFLGALAIAAMRSPDYLQIINDDDASTDYLSRVTAELMQQHQMPAATRPTGEVRWTVRTFSPRSKRRGLFRRRETLRELVDHKLTLIEPPGENYNDPYSGMSLLRRLADSHAVLFMFDPIRELEHGDGIEFAQHQIEGLASAVSVGRGARLPHYVAVCITKMDEPRVFEAAQHLGLLSYNENDPYMTPRVLDDDALLLLSELSSRSPTKPNLDLHKIFDRYFHRERIKYFATSSIGFYIDRNEKFREDDYNNLVAGTSGMHTIRGSINPVNVMEPLLWLTSKIG